MKKLMRLSTMDTAAFRTEFLLDQTHRTRWKAFLKKKKALIPVDFEDAVTCVKTFAEQLLNDGGDGKDSWNPEEKVWL